MNITTERSNAEKRIAGNGAVVTTFKAAKRNGVPDLDMVVIQEGTVFTIDKDYKLYQIPIPGTNNTYLALVSREGIIIPVSVYTRAATDATTGERVKPSGTAIDAFYKKVTMEEAFNEIVDKPQKLMKKTVVNCENRQGEAYTVNVWTVDFVA